MTTATETTGKLKPKIKAEWLRRLRSGEHPQGTGELCGNGRYCCLGVGGKLLAEMGVGKWVGGEGSFGVDSGRDAGLHWSLLPDADWYVEAVGINLNEAEVLPSKELAARLSLEHEPTTLAALNDSGATFLEIADLIEVQL